MIQAIALGANLSARKRSRIDTLEQALRHLVENPSVSVIRRSRWYRSPAWPPGSGPEFVNAAALIESDLPPAGVLRLLHGIEERLGRVRKRRWAPRACDLDLLFAGDRVLPDRKTCAGWMALDRVRARTAAPPHLVLPHPRMHERAFVLAPLGEIAPDWNHPVTGLTVAEMIRALPAADFRRIRPIGE